MRFCSNPGSRYEPEYKAKILDDGSTVVVVDRYIDLYSRIQADADSCDINRLIALYNAGDTEALNRVRGIFADVTDMPKTYAEILQAVNDGIDLFSKLPLEVRAKFGNDVNRWFAAINSPAWFDAMGFKPKTNEEEKEEKESEPDA